MPAALLAPRSQWTPTRPRPEFADWPPPGAVAGDLADGLYAGMAGAGLEYGPGVPGAAAGWRRGTRSSPRWRCRKRRPWTTAFGLHPALLDAAVQASWMRASGDGGDVEDGEVRLPFAWTRGVARTPPVRWAAGPAAARFRRRSVAGGGGRRRRAGGVGGLAGVAAELAAGSWRARRLRDALFRGGVGAGHGRPRPVPGGRCWSWRRTCSGAAGMACSRGCGSWFRRPLRCPTPSCCAAAGCRARGGCGRGGARRWSRAAGSGAGVAWRPSPGRVPPGGGDCGAVARQARAYGHGGAAVWGLVRAAKRRIQAVSCWLTWMPAISARSCWRRGRGAASRS